MQTFMKVANKRIMFIIYGTSVQNQFINPLTFELNTTNIKMYLIKNANVCFQDYLYYYDLNQSLRSYSTTLV